MNLLRLSLLFFSLNSFAGYTIFNDSLDEFTDEREIFIGVMGDEHNDFSEKFIAIYCDKSDKPRLILKNGIMFNLNERLKVKFRFDKNEPYTHIFKYQSKGSLMYSYDKRFIKYFFDYLRTSNNLIIKIEDSTGIMRFSDLTKSETNVDKFKEAASEMDQDCRIF